MIPHGHDEDIALGNQVYDLINLCEKNNYSISFYYNPVMVGLQHELRVVNDTKGIRLLTRSSGLLSAIEEMIDKINRKNKKGLAHA